jgi:hypothetical protein
MTSSTTVNCIFVNVIANQVKIVSLGGIEAIIKAMSSHKDHSGVQEQACGALLKLAHTDGMVSTALCISLIDLCTVAIPVHGYDEWLHHIFTASSSS